MHYIYPESLFRKVVNSRPFKNRQFLKIIAVIIKNRYGPLFFVAMMSILIPMVIMPVVEQKSLFFGISICYSVFVFLAYSFILDIGLFRIKQMHEASNAASERFPWVFVLTDDARKGMTDDYNLWTAEQFTDRIEQEYSLWLLTNIDTLEKYNLVNEVIKKIEKLNSF